MKRLILFLMLGCLWLSGCAPAEIPNMEQGEQMLPTQYSENIVDLTRGLTVDSPSLKEPDAAFYRAQTALGLELLRQGAAEEPGKNLLISPLSVAVALAMAANGAQGETAAEIQTVLGGYSVEDLNSYMAYYLENIPFHEKATLHLGNSVWYRDAERLEVKKDFLEKTANHYDAQIFKAPFDASTVEDINYWVAEQTDEMILGLLEEIEDDVVMYLINALTFDGEWQQVYKENDVFPGQFTTYSGTRQEGEMMLSTESYFLENSRATGFLKNYAGGRYQFGALLPREGVDLYEYMNELTAESLQDTLKNVQRTSVEVHLPKFSHECNFTLNKMLKSIGMKRAFDQDRADFTPMAVSAKGNIYVSRVMHKTFIDVNENGTRAGAVTAVELEDKSAMMVDRFVKLDRPFIYFIIDRENNLPIFIGAVTEL